MTPVILVPGSVDLGRGFCDHTRAYCLPFHDRGEVEDGVNSSVLCQPIQRVAGNTSTHTSQWKAPAGEGSVAPLPAGVLQSRLPHSTAQKGIWGLVHQQLGSRTCPCEDCDRHRAKRKPVSKSTANTVTTTVIASVKAETTSIR